MRGRVTSLHSLTKRSFPDACHGLSKKAQSCETRIHRPLFGRKEDHPSSFEDRPSFASFKHLNTENTDGLPAGDS